MGMRKTKGFTVVELLIVIVVIAILAAVTIVGYNTVTRNANEASLRSDLKNAGTEIGIFFFENKRYPNSAEEAGLQASGDNSIVYTKRGAGYCMDIYSPRITGVRFMSTHEKESPEMGSCFAPDSCFYFDANTGRIGAYRNYENSESSAPACPKDVYIPSTIGGVAVVGFGSYSPYSPDARLFESMDITSVWIPESIESIPSSTFRGNDIETLFIPDSINSIGSQSFYSNNLKNVSLPSSLAHLQVDPGTGEWAFGSNPNVEFTIRP